MLFVSFKFRKNLRQKHKLRADKCKIVKESKYFNIAHYHIIQGIVTLTFLRYYVIINLVKTTRNTNTAFYTCVVKCTIFFFYDMRNTVMEYCEEEYGLSSFIHFKVLYIFNVHSVLKFLSWKLF